MVEHCASSAKCCGLNSQATHILIKTFTVWMHCKSLWIKTSAKIHKCKYFSEAADMVYNRHFTVGSCPSALLKGYLKGNTFTFMQLADAFIQSDLQYILAIHFVSVINSILMCYLLPYVYFLGLRVVLKCNSKYNTVKNLTLRKRSTCFCMRFLSLLNFLFNKLKTTSWENSKISVNWLP